MGFGALRLCDVVVVMVVMIGGLPRSMLWPDRTLFRCGGGDGGDDGGGDGGDEVVRRCCVVLWRW